ncbi:MAG TPA: hypothetical protein VNJ08_17330 [Bacteriovoracaceae bacterium]|nr:hypothetical protein [Bacteriovoracaceae bacterium]
MKIIPFTLLLLSMNLGAETPNTETSPGGLGNSAPSDATNTGIEPTPSSPSSQGVYPNSGQTQNRSGASGATDMPISETSSSNSRMEQMNTSPNEVPSQANETQKSDNTTLSSDHVYPTGPYKNGEYSPSIGEERQAEEERLQDSGEHSDAQGGEEETRVNQMGPNKR